jgi:type I restriction enzyme, S subunit
MSEPIDISPGQRKALLALIQRYLPNVEVWAFGSRVKWTARSNSDLDLVAFAKPEDESRVSQLKEAMEESALPFRMDLLVWDNIPEGFQRNIRERYVVLVEAEKTGRGWAMAFDTTPLGELMGDKGYIRGPFGSALKRAELKENGIPVYEQQHAIDGVRTFRYFVDDDKYSELRRFTVEPNDLIISCSDTVGRISVIRADDPKGIISQALLILRPDVEKVLPYYLYYFLTSKVGAQELINASHGAVQLNIAPRNIVEKIPVPLPAEIEIQQQIVRQLKVIDDKIDINHRINQTLEAMAQAIFRSWFVDFDPVKAKIAARQEGRDPLRAAMTAISGKPDSELDTLAPEQYEQLAASAALFPDEMEDSELGEIPKGWKTGSLSNFASFQNGYAFKTKDWTDSGHPVVKIGNVKPGIIDLSGCSYVAHETVNGLDRFALNKGDLLVGMTGYVGETGLIPALDSVAYLNQRVGRISTANGINDIGYPYCLVRDPAYKAYAESKAHGSAQANVSGKDLMDFPAVVPDARSLSIFNAQAEKIINTLLSFHEESQRLIALRDTLLPRLLSGELSVTEATAEVEI